MSVGDRNRYRAENADGRFERELLESARRDPKPRDAEAAWARFAGTARFVAATAEPSGLYRMEEPTDAQTQVTAPSAPTLPPPAPPAWPSAAGWLVTGLVAGGAITAGVMLAATDVGIDSAASTRTSAALSARPAVARAAVSPPKREAPKDSPAALETGRSIEPRSTDPSGDLAAPAAPRATGARRMRRVESLAGARPQPTGASAQAPRAPEPSAVDHRPAADASTLGAEVARLDAARRAFRLGAYARAVRLIDAYRREFPAGELRPDAEVIAIEALGQERRTSAAARRATRFLTRYPGDPHADRVRRWVGRH